MMSIGAQVQVGKGGTFDRDGLVFGGFNMLPAGDGGPTQVIISVWDHKSSEQDFKLTLGETFEFEGQTWRLDEIDDSSHRWYAVLTRVA
jgi:Family of unknown function (DUF6406)